MKRLVPSTHGEVSFTVHRLVGKVTTPKRFAKFMSVRPEANTLVAGLDTPDNPVVKVEIHYTFPPEQP